MFSDDRITISGIKTIRQIMTMVINDASPLRSPSALRSLFFTGLKMVVKIAAHKMAEK